MPDAPVQTTASIGGWELTVKAPPSVTWFGIKRIEVEITEGATNDVERIISLKTVKVGEKDE